MQALHHDPVPKDVLSMMVDQGRTVTSGQEKISENSGIQDNNGVMECIMLLFQKGVIILVGLQTDFFCFGPVHRSSPASWIRPTAGPAVPVCRHYTYMYLYVHVQIRSLIYLVF
jgi:hypothetical protein